MRFICKHCQEPYERPERYVRQAIRENYQDHYCSRVCHFADIAAEKVVGNCVWCGEKVERDRSKTKRNQTNLFCNASCAASYNNTRKRKSKRSKCEAMLFEKLRLAFPHLDILPNDKTMLGGLEIDIAIPSLKLGIEWNGVVHFLPIYGQQKLDRVQELDREKLKIAARNEIRLIIIPDLVSTKAKVEEAFLDIKKHLSSLLNADSRS